MMRNFTPEQVNQVSEFLKKSSVTFVPLQNELTDHLLMDISQQMAKGDSFDEAFKNITSSFSPNQLLTLEQETMDTFSNQNTIITRFSYLGILLLLFTSTFKLLHLPGTTLLLFSSIGSFMISLLLGAVLGIRRYRDKVGSGLLIMVILSVILHMMAWSFLILQLPGATELRIISLISLVISFSKATLRFAASDRFKNSILSYLHEKYTPGIQRILLIVLVFAGLLKIMAMIMNYPPNVAMVLLEFVISGGVLHFFASCWPLNLTKSTAWILISLFIIGMLPALGPLIDMNFRAVLASLFYIGAGLFSLSIIPSHPSQKIIVGLTAVFYALWSGINIGLIPLEINSLFNPPLLFFLISFYAFSNSNSLLRIYFLIVIAHYLLEYPFENGLSF